MSTWEDDIYIYYTRADGLVMHKKEQIAYNPTFEDFNAQDWIESKKK